MRPHVLSIAGYDPSAGAGVLADIKTFEANKVYGLGVTTAMTWQNESEFEKVEWLSSEKIFAQIDLLLRKSKVAYAKIGLVENATTLQEVVEFLRQTNPKIKIVWDPILKASAGFDFHSSSSLEQWKSVLPKLFLITPNWQEMEWLGEGKTGLLAAEELKKLCHIFLKGGHNEQKKGYDYLITHAPAPSHQTKTYPYKPTSEPISPKHGSGCVLSSAITAYLAKGYPLHRACLMAKQYTAKFLTSNPTLLGYHKI